MEPRLTDSANRYEAMQGSRDYLIHIKSWGRALITGRSRSDFLREAIGARADRFEKAAVTAITTSSSLAAQRPLSRDFLAGIVQRSVLGQLAGALAVPSNTRVNVAMLFDQADFVAESAPVPVASGIVQSRNLSPVKLGLIVVFANEIFLATDDRALNVIDRGLRRAFVRGLNSALLGTAAAVDMERPAGLLYGLSPQGGGSPSSVDDDLLATVAACRGGVPDAPVWVLSPLGAAYLATIDGRFQNVSMHPGRPGTMLGCPQICSEAADGRAILIDAAAITYSDDGMEMDVSTASALQMDDAPANAAASLVSMFQDNATAVRGRWFIDWGKGDDAVSFCELPIPVGSPAW